MSQVYMIFYKELAEKEAEKRHHLPSAGWRPGEAGGAVGLLRADVMV